MKKLIVLTVVVLAGVWLFRSDNSSISDDRNQVVNRAWIDKIPDNMRDKIDVFIAQDDPRFGAFQRTSAYEGDYTVFQWSDDGGGKLTVFMLQSGKKHKLRAKVSRNNCKQFDLCMSLSGAPRGARKYYSMNDWVIDGKVTPERLRAFIRTKLLKQKAE